jgi:hypothetical protein
MSEKKKTESQAETLNPKWVAAEADSALAVAGEAGDRVVALVDAWVHAGNAAAVSVVADRGAGAGRKAARRGLNVLRSRGVKVDEQPRVTSLAAGQREPEAVVEAWLVPPDSSGTSLVVIASRSTTSRAQSGFFQLHDVVGLHQVSTGELSGGALKDALKRASENGAQAVRIPLEYARYRVALGREQSKKIGQPEPLGLTRALELLTGTPTETVAHPLENEGLEIADEDAKDLAKTSASLHNLREFRGWLPDRGAVDEMLREVGEHLQGQSEPPVELMQAAMKDGVEAATDRYFGPERRALLVSRMRDAALSVLSAEGETRALEVVATMKRIELCGLITDPPREVPFLRAFFDKAVAVLAMQGGGRLQVPIRKQAPVEAPPAESATATTP